MHLVENYKRDGYISGIRLLQESEAKTHRNALEHAESTQGDLHYLAKIHTIFKGSDTDDFSVFYSLVF